MLPASFKRYKRWNSNVGTLRLGGICWPAQGKAPTGLEVCLPLLARARLSLACVSDATPGPLQPKLCYQDLHSALLLDPKHPQAKVLFQMMVDQAQQAHQDAGILAVQGKLQHALQRISSAIENNPLDPILFLFRYWVGRCQTLGTAVWSQESP